MFRKKLSFLSVSRPIGGTDTPLSTPYGLLPIFAALLLCDVAPAWGHTDKGQHQVQPQYDKYFTDGTLRVDYYRIGNSHWDTISLHGYGSKSSWAGSNTILLDPFDYGTYRVLVKDHYTGREIYSRTYNTLFHEYCDTPEGKDSVARMEEVVLLPWPKSKIDICLQKRDEHQQFQTSKTLYFNPKHEHGITDRQEPSDRQLLQLQYNGEPRKKIDIAIVPEGYGPDDTNKMRADMRDFTEYIFRVEPFRSRREDFNVWGVLQTGESSGITDPSKGIKVRSTVGASYGTFGSDRYLMTFNLFRLHDVLSNTPCDHIIIMANSDTYGGGAIYNFYAISAVTTMSPYILPHELGHSIGGLADEYVEEDGSYADIHKTPYEPTEPNITNLVDFDKKWKDLVAADTPIPTPPCTLDNPMGTCGTIGVFEGAGYAARGLYRPVMNCMMRYYAPFCPVCTRALNAIFDIYL